MLMTWFTDTFSALLVLLARWCVYRNTKTVDMCLAMCVATAFGWYGSLWLIGTNSLDQLMAAFLIFSPSGLLLWLPAFQLSSSA